MKLESVGILIGLRPFGERDQIAHIFTRDFGVMVGMLRGGAAARKNKPLIGQVGNVSWNARLDSQLGVFHWESTRNLAAPLMSNASALAYMNAAFALIQTLLAEREKYETLYDETIGLLEGLSVGSTRPLRAGRNRDAISGWGNNSSRGYTKQILSNAQSLRKNTTDAERLMWSYFGNYKNHLGFSRQRPIGKYIVDFINFEKKLIIELDGAQHGDGQSRHYDEVRDKFLEDAGYKVLRFWNDEVFRQPDMVLKTIGMYLYDYPILQSRCDSVPHPEIALQFRLALEGRVNPCSDSTYPYLNWEISLLRELGYALDLSRCSGCGTTENLNYLSPRTGRAVCDKCATPYIGRLLELPLTVATTEKFIARICEEQGAKFPALRKIL